MYGLVRWAGPGFLQLTVWRLTGREFHVFTAIAQPRAEQMAPNAPKRKALTPEEREALTKKRGTLHHAWAGRKVRISLVFRLRKGFGITEGSPRQALNPLRSCLVQDDASAAPASSAGLDLVGPPVGMEIDAQPSSLPPLPHDPPATPSIPGSGNFPFPLPTPVGILEPLFCLLVPGRGLSCSKAPWITPSEASMPCLCWNAQAKGCRAAMGSHRGALGMQVVDCSGKDSPGGSGVTVIEVEDDEESSGDDDYDDDDEEEEEEEEDDDTCEEVSSEEGRVSLTLIQGGLAALI
jgi:hypothetical protein